MSELIVMNTGTYIQYKIVEVDGEKKVYSLNGNEATISYDDVERGLASGQYKEMD